MGRAIFKYLGSLNFAIVLIVALAVVLTVSTTLEAVYGTDFAQIFIYRTGWFDLFLGLVGVNILFSALLRWPYRVAHTGFLVTHVGILILLVGSMITRVWGVEGSILLYEGQQGQEIVRDSYKLRVTTPQKEIRVELPYKSLGPKTRSVCTMGPFDIRLQGSLTNVARESVIVEGAKSDPLNYAVRVVLSSARAGFKKGFWLVEKDPADPLSSVLALGRAELSLVRSDADRLTAPVIEIRLKSTDELFKIDPANAPGVIPLGLTGLSVSGVRYFADARVENGKLVSMSDQPNNPAVELVMAGPEAGGKVDRLRYIAFALYPDYASFHDTDPKLFKDVEVLLRVPLDAVPQTPQSATLKFFASSNGWSYRSQLREMIREGVLKEGEEYPAGWMDFRFKVEKMLTRARVAQETRPEPAVESKMLAAKIAVLDEGRVIFNDWVVDGEPVDLRSGGGQKLRLLVDKDTTPIPFDLTLKDFRKVDYPGSFQPSSFESDVVLNDPEKGLQIERTIRMNRPMDHRGFRIFQSSYLRDEDGSEASVFTVAKNPGITLIYSGSAVLVAGIVMVFFIRPLSTLKMQSQVKRSS